MNLIMRKFSTFMLIFLLATAPLQGASAAMEMPANTTDSCHDINADHHGGLHQSSTPHDCEDCDSRLTCDSLCCAQGHCVSSATAVLPALISITGHIPGNTDLLHQSDYLSHIHYGPYRPPRA